MSDLILSKPFETPVKTGWRWPKLITLVKPRPTCEVEYSWIDGQDLLDRSVKRVPLNSFDGQPHWSKFWSDGISERYVRLLRTFSSLLKSRVSTYLEESAESPLNFGVRQGSRMPSIPLICTIVCVSPRVINCFREIELGTIVGSPVSNSPTTLVFWERSSQVYSLF